MTISLRDRLTSNGPGQRLSDIPPSVFELDHIDEFHDRLRKLLTHLAATAHAHGICDAIVSEAEAMKAKLDTHVTKDDFASAESCHAIRAMVYDVVACADFYGWDDIHRDASELVRLINRRRNHAYPYPEFAWLYS
jgi:hypothetical protein